MQLQVSNLTLGVVDKAQARLQQLGKEKHNQAKHHKKKQAAEAEATRQRVWLQFDMFCGPSVL